MTIKKIYESMDYGPAQESDILAREWIKSHGPKFRQFVNGKWVAPKAKKYLISREPSTGRKLASIPLSGKQDINHAVRSAHEAFDNWKKLSCHVRARYLYAMARQIQKNARLFAVLEALDNGKTIRETRDIDIPLVARHFYHHAGWAQVRDSALQGYEPLGVIGQIIPWNFPMLMLAWKIAPALAMGNTVVLKPAEYTSLTALLFAEICEQINLPPGVVNIVTGDGSTGAELVKHRDISKIAFTGSTEVGRKICQVTADSEKRLSLELGGKSPFIVFDDADLDGVVEGIVDAIWFNQGQVCCAGSRLLVQESITNKLYRKIKNRMEKLRVGHSLDKGVDIGAIVAPVQLKTIESLVSKGLDEGADMWQPSWTCPKEGWYYPPTLFTNVAPASLIAQEEIFGPVLVAMSFRTPSEAVKLANNTRYGLAASIWTENINLALDIAPKVKAGSVWVNCTNVFDAASGFGGYRESGFGREGGIEGLYEYVRFGIEKDFLPAPTVLSPLNKSKGVGNVNQVPGIDRTAKMYMGGKQKRPDGGYNMPVFNASGDLAGQVGLGNRKDIRNAVEAAHAAEGWSTTAAHTRAQVLYFVGENLEARAAEFAGRLSDLLGQTKRRSLREVNMTLERIFTYAAYADKYEGTIHDTPYRNVTLAMKEPLGVMGIVCPEEAPLLGFVSAVLPPIAMGNTVVAVPSSTFPLLATDLYQVLDTSDVPPGVVNIVTGDKDLLADVLSDHDDVDGLWYFGSREGSTRIRYSSAANMKRTWVNFGRNPDWFDPAQTKPDYFLHKAVQIKNIWIPYGE